MKLQVLSDLHCEFADSPFNREDMVGDLVLCAGDTVVRPSKLRMFATAMGIPMLCVLGNHEFYGQDWPSAVMRYQLEVKGTNARVLEMDVFEGAGFRVLGCTVWTDLACGKRVHEVEHHLSDYICIQNGGRLLNGTDTIIRHKTSLEWLALKLGEPYNGKTIVLTHHAPSWKSQHPKWAASTIGSAFCSDLEWLIEEYQPYLWVHGHLHDSCDYMCGDTRVICNPRGYCRMSHPVENPQFNPRLVLEV